MLPNSSKRLQPLKGAEIDSHTVNQISKVSLEVNAHDYGAMTRAYQGKINFVD
jgi:hypothetical protein